MIPEDVKVMAYDVIRKAMDDWGMEDEKGYVAYCEGVFELADVIANELDRVRERGVHCDVSEF